MYNGLLQVYDPTTDDTYPDWEPIYWQNDVSYEISPSYRNAPEMPDIRIAIPFDRLYKDAKENVYLKRLTWYFLQMEHSTTTYQYKDIEASPPRNISVYAGKMVYLPIPIDQEPEFEYDSTYWRKDISYTLEEPDKLHKGCPSVVVGIPEEKFLPPELTERMHENGEELPVGYVYTNPYTTAAADYCLRRIAKYFDPLNAELDNRSRPVEENGFYYVHRPDSSVLPRNSAYFARCATKYYENVSGCRVRQLPDDKLTPPRPCLCIRIQVQLPAGKLKKAIKMLCTDLPDAIERFIADFDPAELERTLELTAKQEQIRAYLADSEYCVFLANGSILPRNKLGGPLLGAVPFASVAADEIEVAGVRGMGIRRGVTVITGGGYSGKSTLLDAIAAGIYNHVQGDGRELVLTDETAMEIAAEDGRCVKRANISPFIRWIPGGDPADFSTDHASGSTSQAANILESVHDGAKLLLIDEDRSATNFMIRDRMMKALIRHEPITPYTDRVRELSAAGVSSILVIGGSGEYLGVADRVYRMDDFRISDATAEAGAVWADNRGTVLPEEPEADADTDLWKQDRILSGEGFSSYPERSGTEWLSVDDLGVIRIGEEAIDIRDIGGLKTTGQQNSAALILRTLMIRRKTETVDLDDALDALYWQIGTDGLEVVFSSFFTDCSRFLDLPRIRDVKAVVYRMRNTVWSHPDSGR
ncbi:MAG: hypothetical protein IKY52_04995 [Clostridia bacterium]|nr:hypothetical protein [Clostridia bacterium]